MLSDTVTEPTRLMLPVTVTEPTRPMLTVTVIGPTHPMLIGSTSRSASNLTLSEFQQNQRRLVFRSCSLRNIFCSMNSSGWGSAVAASMLIGPSLTVPAEISRNVFVNGVQNIAKFITSYSEYIGIKTISKCVNSWQPLSETHQLPTMARQYSNSLLD